MGAWEFSFGVYMTVKGFKPAAVIDLRAGSFAPEAIAPAYA